MRINDSLPPMLPEGPRVHAGINSFSSSAVSQVQGVETELLVPAAATVESEVEGNTPDRERRVTKRDENGEADQRQGSAENKEGKQSLDGADAAIAEDGENDAEEESSQKHQLDVTL